MNNMLYYFVAADLIMRQNLFKLMKNFFEQVVIQDKEQFDQENVQKQGRLHKEKI